MRKTEKFQKRFQVKKICVSINYYTGLSREINYHVYNVKIII